MVPLADFVAAVNFVVQHKPNDGRGGTATSAAIALGVAAALVPFPVAIAVDGAGNLYVTDSSTHVVQKITTANQVATVAGSAGTTGLAGGTSTAARFNQPGRLTATSAGVLTVADTANATIRRVFAAGVVTTLAGSATLRGNADGAGATATFGRPIGIAQNSAGTFAIADVTNHTLRQLTAANQVSTLAGAAGSPGSADGGITAARFHYPTGVAFDAAGTLYGLDTTNNLIRRIGADGQVTTLAGVSGVSGWADGSGSGALFNQPRVLAVDDAGNVYVADTGNAAIRRTTPDGAVTMLVLTPAPAGSTDNPAGSGNTTPPPSGAGSGSNGGGGGGGGAPSLWFLAAAGLAALVRGWGRCP